MKNRNKKHEQRIKKLIVGCSLCAMLLTVSTYAWFIGMKTVNISPFEVKIAAIDALSLSLDGKTWHEEVEISEDTYNDTDYVYTNHTNSWGGPDGLVPMSTIGVIDPVSSRLILYEKGSLTTSPGGYRLMASRVANNGGNPEQRGYVAFDLFIKNSSGDAYYSQYNEKNEEAIYLTLDSAVTPEVVGTGIENSVRVAFTQIGRVISTTADTSVITGINCNNNNVVPEGEYDPALYNAAVTGICQRVATIWEPNDTKHVQNARTWYRTSCLKRTAKPMVDASYGRNLEEDEYGTQCDELSDDTYYPTYAISAVIDESNMVDVYDGEEFNGWMGSVTDGKLAKFDYFTDTEKNLPGTSRPTFMNLAPNSITKVRIYIYIEGQDVDNYDFASLGEKIEVNFGFTKERLFGEDINYDGSNTTSTLPGDVIRGY